jgi:AraC family transcriptional regulator, transcriptional activator of the genes for pyochelin and ferripyochelin receptors
MRIYSSNIFDLQKIPHPQAVKPGQKSFEEFTNHHHDGLGTFRFKNLALPHMHLMDVRFETEQFLEMHDHLPSPNININYHLSGNLDTRFSGIPEELNMRSRKHNLVFSPAGGLVNKVGAHSSLEMFHVSLDQRFFLDLIGCNDHWSEQAHENLLHSRPFAGAKGTLDVTPAMYRLISEIRNATYTGPMRNLMIQSKVLELLALQLGQFTATGMIIEDISPADMDKLHALKAILDRDFLNEFTLTHLSRACLLNEFKMKKGFKKLFGHTVFGYIRKLRMEYAQSLLLDGGRSVEEVADVLGYEHPQHFSVAFKKYTGVRPSEAGNHSAQFLSRRICA